ncbi:hypothetical protein LCGC14_0538710 [marine sediment metagenome]|uniref:Uncharacterized protein n=1 Tax=marine sediment metagenome TaxID=412755 RepID=A0A0F9UEZ5_9ZZZZ
MIMDREKYEVELKRLYDDAIKAKDFRLAFDILTIGRGDTQRPSRPRPR